MLTAEKLDDLISSRLSAERAAELLLDLTPERLDLPLFSQIVERLSAACSQQLPSIDFDVLDCCGTGGSGVPHFNTSTTSAIVLAAGEVKVAKFGNRAATGRSGSADFLDAIGLSAEIEPGAAVELLHDLGLALFFAPSFYPFLSNLREIRQKVGVKTVLNFVGPLLNPIRPSHRLLGVSDPIMQKLIASFIAASQTSVTAMVVRGPNNLDEISETGSTEVLEVRNGTLSEQEISAETHFPLLPRQKTASYDDSQNSTSENARIFFDLLDGEAAPRYSQLVSLNAGAAFYIAGKSATIDDGVTLATELLASGAVKDKYQQLRNAYARLHA
jgi:anthranilate phosphoribosyltransferase